MLVRLTIQTLAFVVVLAVLLFLPAGTLAWAGAWAFIAELALPSVVIGVWLARHDPALLKERMAGLFRPGQSRADRALMALFLVLTVAWLVIMALDAMRFRLSHVPLWLQVVGGIGVAFCFYVAFITFRANSYAAAAVRLQPERGHRVVTDGPYAVVRHPMYAGAIFYFLGTPLLLGSWYGVAFAPVFVVLLASRAVMEERLLTRALEGYPAYAARVRWRLVPFVW